MLDKWAVGARYRARQKNRYLSRKIAVRSFDVLLLCHTDDYKHKALTIIRLTH